MPGSGVVGEPLYPFQNPAHALVLVAFGAAFWTVATLIRSAAKNKTTIVEASRHNPWFVLFHRRSMTLDEANARLPPWFWTVYGAGGVCGQWIGGLFSGFGLVGLVVSLTRKLF